MTYSAALAFTLSQEGGWYDGSGSHDPNPTMKGITQKTYDAYRKSQGLPTRSVKLVDNPELQAIYRKYWDASRCADWGELTGQAVFDHAVNAGPRVAIAALQRAAGVNDDGVVGPKTREAVKARIDAVLADRVLWERLAFYRKLAAPPGSKHRQSLLSWLSRVIALRSSWKH